MTHLITIIGLLLTAGSAFAGSKTVTFFSDGVVVEIEATAAKGIAEIPLPAGIMEGTLRISPLKGTTIQRVDLIPARREVKQEKELDLLREQRSRLEDRLQALTTREEIFKSAAKSQSGKAPRKTKSNPEPMQSIRQGTEFAIAQLEAVYTARRRTEQEIIRLDARISATRKGKSGVETIARVTTTSSNGKIKARYIPAGPGGWTPRYDLRLNGDGNANLTLYGHLPDSFGSVLLQASPVTLSDSTTARSITVNPNLLARFADYRLPASEEQFEDGLRSSFSCIVTNPGPAYLPAGVAAIYRKGEYRGEVRFKGISSGRSRKISSGI